MRVRPAELSRRLEQPLAPLYLVCGDEPLQREEALDLVRAAARAQGYDERVVLHADGGFDWSELADHTDSLSLFAERRLIDLRIPATRPDDKGVKMLVAYAGRPAPDTVLLISLSRHDYRQTSSRWFKAIERAGVVVQTWPIEAAQLPRWTARRAHAAGLRLTPDAAALVAERAEGNLLALAQEIDKLALLHRGVELDAETVIATVADSARFGPFDLLDAMLGGNTRRALRIAATLRDEGIDPNQVLGALVWGLRAVTELAHLAPRGDGLQRALADPRMGAWRRREALLGPALRRHSVADWRRLLRAAASLDRVAKGLPACAGAPAPRGSAAWDALTRLVAECCGAPLALAADSL